MKCSDFPFYRNTQLKDDTGIVRNAKPLRIESSNCSRKHYARKADLFLLPQVASSADGYVICEMIMSKL